MKTLYLECNMGTAGDMLMAALYELMTESEKHDFLETMNRLFPGVEIHPPASRHLRHHRHPHGRHRLW